MWNEDGGGRGGEAEHEHCLLNSHHAYYMFHIKEMSIEILFNPPPSKIQKREPFMRGSPTVDTMTEPAPAKEPAGTIQNCRGPFSTCLHF